MLHVCQSRKFVHDCRMALAYEVLQHRRCLVEGTESIIFAHSILLQEIVLQESSDVKSDLIALSQCRFADQLDNFGQIILFL